MPSELKINPIILCGGFGTRIKSKSNGLPKSLMPIGGKVFLDYILESLAIYKIEKIILSLHYKPEAFFSYLDEKRFPFKIIPIVEPKPMGTGGAIKYILENESISNPFIVLNGDSLSNINLDKMKTVFDESNYNAILGLSYVKNSSRYGKVNFKGDSLISYCEKNSNGPGWINNGHYIFKKELFKSFSGEFSLEKNVFPKLLEKNKLGVHTVKNDSFIDMGIPEDYERLCNMFEVSK